MTAREEAMERLLPYIARAHGFSGWDLSEIRCRPIDPPPPWDYVGRARELAAGAVRTLDIGTGGGEVFSEVLQASRGSSSRVRSGW